MYESVEEKHGNTLHATTRWTLCVIMKQYFAPLYKAVQSSPTFLQYRTQWDAFLPPIWRIFAGPWVTVLAKRGSSAMITNAHAVWYHNEMKYCIGPGSRVIMIQHEDHATRASDRLFCMVWCFHCNYHWASIRLQCNLITFLLVQRDLYYWYSAYPLH